MFVTGKLRHTIGAGGAALESSLLATTLPPLLRAWQREQVQMPEVFRDCEDPTGYTLG